jgi:hypothetical protein
MWEEGTWGGGDVVHFIHLSSIEILTNRRIFRWGRAVEFKWLSLFRVFIVFEDLV